MAASLGLDVSNVVSVDIVISPNPAQLRNFGIGIGIGDSAVIPVQQRFRTYNDLDEVIADFGVNTPEYAVADAVFSQEPQPEVFQIGRWASAATAGALFGQLLTPTQQAITNFNSISTGSFIISIDGTSHTVTGLDFTSDLTLNGVASTIQAGLPSGVHCVWNAVYDRFQITSSTTGAASAVLPMTTAGSGVFIGTLAGLTAATGAISYPGVIAETFTQAIAALSAISNQWYCALPNATVTIQESDYLNAAALIEGLSPSRIMGITSSDGTILNTAYNEESPGDLPSALAALGYFRVFVQYSSNSPTAAASMYARAATVDFTAQDSTLTLKFKQEPGVAAEFLAPTQEANLTAKNCNVFAAYNNGTSILQEGVMSNGYFFDEVFNCDWLQNYIQTNLWNLLYGALKIPQTDPGIHQLLNNVNQSMGAGVYNGMIGPGVYEGPPFGTLSTGDTLANGYYSYAAPVATQSQANRAARKAPTIQSGITLAGAVHFASVIVNVTR